MRKFLTALMFPVASSFLSAAGVSVQNLNIEGTSAYGLFDEAGTLISDTFTNNIRIGYFADAFDPNAAWLSGDISLLNANFVQFGDAFGMLNGLDGVFQGNPAANSTPFSGVQITLWATNGSSFNDQSGQHLIYTFDSLTFQSEPWTGGQVFLGTDSGSFLNEGGFASGGFNNFSNDFGGGLLPGFNTVSPVPEPSTYALIAGIFVLGYSFVRRSRGRKI